MSLAKFWYKLHHCSIIINRAVAVSVKSSWIVVNRPYNLKIQCHVPDHIIYEWFIATFLYKFELLKHALHKYYTKKVLLT